MFTEKPWRQFFSVEFIFPWRFHLRSVTSHRWCWPTMPLIFRRWSSWTRKCLLIDPLILLVSLVRLRTTSFLSTLLLTSNRSKSKFQPKPILLNSRPLQKKNKKKIWFRFIYKLFSSNGPKLNRIIQISRKKELG